MTCENPINITFTNGETMQLRCWKCIHCQTQKTKQNATRKQASTQEGETPYIQIEITFKTTANKKGAQK